MFQKGTIGLVSSKFEVQAQVCGLPQPPGQPGHQRTVSVPHEAIIEDAAADECSTGNLQIATLASLLTAHSYPT